MSVVEFNVSEDWRQRYPGAAVGILALANVHNPKSDPTLEAEKAALEQDLRQQFAQSDRQSLRALPTLQAYHTYYKQFKKSYHVQLQLESVLFKGKTIPRVAALVEAMFMAELKNQLLTAGHDLDTVAQPFSIMIAKGDERYQRINGQEQTLKEGDMYIADGQGIMSSIIYGPDQRTQIEPETTAAVFTVYAPQGIDLPTVENHLEDIRAFVSLFSPDLSVLEQHVYEAGAEG